jgi:hypothetical protein
MVRCNTLALHLSIKATKSLLLPNCNLVITTYSTVRYCGDRARSPSTPPPPNRTTYVLNTLQVKCNHFFCVYNWYAIIKLGSNSLVALRLIYLLYAQGELDRDNSTRFTWRLRNRRTGRTKAVPMRLSLWRRHYKLFVNTIKNHGYYLSISLKLTIQSTEKWKDPHNSWVPESLIEMLKNLYTDVDQLQSWWNLNSFSRQAVKQATI